MNPKDTLRSVLIGIFWGSCLSGCGNTSEKHADFPTDTLRVISIKPHFGNKYAAMTAVNKSGVYRCGPIATSNDTIIYPERGDTIVAYRNSDLIKIQRNLTAERLAREFATRQK